MTLRGAGALCALAVAPALFASPSRSTPNEDRAAPVGTLFAIGYSHLDTQWRWTYRDSIREYLPKTMSDNFSLFEKYPNYHFNFTGSRRYRMMNEYYPELFAKVRKYVADGRWYVAGSAVDEADTLVPSGESLVRHVLYGNQYFRREFGKESLDYMLPDCFGFSASLPSVLAHCGLLGFSTQKLTWGSARGIPFDFGVWQGPDGGSVMAALNPGSYAADAPEHLESNPYRMKKIEELGAQSGVFRDVVYHGVGDTGGAPREESVRRVEEAIAAGGPLKVIGDSSDRAFKDLTPSEIARLPKIEGELLLTNHSAGSLTSQAAVKKWNRKGELLADAAERACAMAHRFGLMRYPRKTFASAWDLILGSQMHDILPGTAIPEAYELSWNDQLLAQNLLSSALLEGVSALSSQMDTQAQGVPVVVYNPLERPREEIVEMRLPDFESKQKASAPVKFVEVFDADGKPTWSQIIGDKLVFLAKTPALGLAVFDVRPASKAKPSTLKVTKQSLENERYRVRLDAAGDVASVYDKDLRRELLSAPLRLDLFDDSPREWPAWNMDYDDVMRPAREVVRGAPKIRIVENGPARVALEVARETAGSTFVQKLILSAGEAGNRFEIETTIDWRTLGTTLAAAFPLASANSETAYGSQTATVVRPNSAEKAFEFPHQQWIDLSAKDGSFGVTILEDSKYGSNKPDDATVRLTLIRTPVAYSYQDQATQDLGIHHVKMALVGHKGSWQTADARWNGLRLNQPLRAFQARPHSGSWGRSVSLMEVENPNLTVMAVKLAEAGDDLVVRLNETTGRPAKSLLKLHGPAASARKLDGQERPLGTIEADGRSVHAELGAYGIETIGIAPLAVDAKFEKPARLELPYDTQLTAKRGVKPGRLGDFSFPAELWPGEVELAGGMRLGPAEGPNALASKRRIPIPAGSDRELLLVTAAPKQSTFDVRFSNGTERVSSPAWNGFVGQWYDRVWKSESPDQKPVLDRIYGLRQAYNHAQPVAFYTTHLVGPDGDAPYAYGYLHQSVVRIPNEASWVELGDPNLLVCAAAVRKGQDSLVELTQAQETFETGDAMPLVRAPESSQDSSRIEVTPSIYGGATAYRVLWNGESVRAPFWAHAPGKLEVRWSENGKERTMSRDLEIQDQTPPKVTSARTLAGAGAALVTFSEPVRSELNASPKLELVVPLASNGKLPHLEVVDLSTARNRSFLDVASLEVVQPAIVASPRKTTGPAGPLEPKPIGKGWAFDGASAVEFPHSEALSPKDSLTIYAEVNPRKVDGQRRILQKGRDDDGYRLHLDRGRLLFDVAGVGSIHGPAIPVGKWSRITARYGEGMLRLELDGVLVAEAPASGEIRANGDPLAIGSKRPDAPSSDWWDGEIRRVVVAPGDLPTEMFLPTL